VVLEKNVVEGGRVTPSTRLFRIADLSWIWIEADVFERDLSLVRIGAHATVSLQAYPGESFHGMVTYVYPTVDEATRTGTVRIELSNPELMLKPGMYASISLDAPGAVGALVVPRGALLLTGERTLVYVRRWDGTLEPREVVAGFAAGQEVEILSGLDEGEVVVSSASFLVDAESNLGSVTGGAGSTDPAMGEMDHSQHQMDSAGGGTNHSGHGRP
jgi:RND family efflux transporter MFP subunit